MRNNPRQESLLQALRATPLEGRPGGIEALYVAHFGDSQTPEMWNGGVVVLETERVFGGDSGYYYTGSYQLAGKKLTAALTVRRHHAGWHSAWGDPAPSFEAEVSADRSLDGAAIEGTLLRRDMPQVPLPFRLFRMTELP